MEITQLYTRGPINICVYLTWRITLHSVSFLLGEPTKAGKTHIVYTNPWVGNKTSGKASQTPVGAAYHSLFISPLFCLPRIWVAGLDQIQGPFNSKLPLF